jgi:hypothetical protein
VIQHVSLEIPPDELDRAIGFWRILGFEPIEVPDQLGDEITWLGRDGFHIHLIATAEHSASRRGHPAVVAPDFDRCCEELGRSGFDLSEGPDLWGARRAYAISPGGNRVELMEFPPEN